MKTLLIIGSALGAMTLAMAANAQDDGNGDVRWEDGEGGPRVLKVERMRRPEMETVAFLGVDVTPASSDLASQLGLPEYTGLVVEHVAPGSPAEGVLQPHDVLTRLDDQQLIDWRQFVVLVRDHHPNDSVTLAYVRGGRPATATLKLGQKEAPRLADFDAQIQPFVGRVGELGHQYSEQIKRELRDAQHHLQDDGFWIHTKGSLRPGEVVRTPGNLDMKLVTRDGRSTELTVRDGKKTLTVTGADQKVIFSGPVDTPDQRKALAPDVAADLDRLEHMKEIHLEAGANFPPPPPPLPPPPPPGQRSI